MSYLISAVIEQPKENQTEIPFIFIGGFDGLHWHMAEAKKSPEREIQKLNNICKKLLSNEPNGTTIIEKLLTAPLDEVIIITGESSYESMKNRKPIDCSRGSGNEHITAKDYLKI